MKLLSIALLSIFLGATGQFLLRLGMLQYGQVTAMHIWRELIPILLRPPILLGFVCFAVSSILWLVIISRWPLSYAYPLVAGGYLIAIFYGTFFLREIMTAPKLIGCALILLGIAVLGVWGAST
jgi:drug/metabolite transporter (DMT)-like permease